MGAARSHPRAAKRAALLLLLALLLGASRTEAQVDLTAHPSMVKGPPNAPVTIIEFSDYQ